MSVLRPTPRAVAQALKRLGWEHEEEVSTEEGLVLDMANVHTKTAVEYDGPVRASPPHAHELLFNYVGKCLVPPLKCTTCWS